MSQAPDERLARVLAALAGADDGEHALAGQVCAAAVTVVAVSGAALSLIADDNYRETMCVSSWDATPNRRATVSSLRGRQPSRAGPRIHPR